MNNSLPTDMCSWIFIWSHLFYLKKGAFVISTCCEKYHFFDNHCFIKSIKIFPHEFSNFFLFCFHMKLPAEISMYMLTCILFSNFTLDCLLQMLQLCMLPCFGIALTLYSYSFQCHSINIRYIEKRHLFLQNVSMWMYLI